MLFGGSSPQMIRHLQSLESQEVFTSQGWYTLCALAVGQHQRTKRPNQNAALQWLFTEPCKHCYTVIIVVFVSAISWFSCFLGRSLKRATEFMAYRFRAGERGVKQRSGFMILDGRHYNLRTGPIFMTSWRSVRTDQQI